MRFSGQAHGFALRLPQIRHDRREAEPAFIAVQNVALSCVFQAMQMAEGLLDALLSFGTNGFFRHTPRPAEGEAKPLHTALYGVPADLFVFF